MTLAQRLLAVACLRDLARHAFEAAARISAHDVALVAQGAGAVALLTLQAVTLWRSHAITQEIDRLRRLVR